MEDYDFAEDTDLTFSSPSQLQYHSDDFQKDVSEHGSEEIQVRGHEQEGIDDANEGYRDAINNESRGSGGNGHDFGQQDHFHGQSADLVRHLDDPIGHNVQQPIVPNYLHGNGNIIQDAPKNSAEFQQMLYFAMNGSKPLQTYYQWSGAPSNNLGSPTDNLPDYDFDSFDDPSSYKENFQNEVEWRDYKEGRLRRQRQKALDALRTAGHKDLPGFPIHPDAQRAWVRKLYDAFKHTDDILDKPLKNGQPCQAAQRLTAGYYPDKELESTCWDILFYARDAHLGLRLVGSHHKLTVETNDSVKTFADRMEGIIDSMKASKALCKQLLDPEFLPRFAMAPSKEFRMKKANKKINAMRDAQNQIGRKILAQANERRKAKGEDEQNDDEDENEDYLSSSSLAAVVESARKVTPASSSRRRSRRKGRSSSSLTPGTKRRHSKNVDQKAETDADDTPSKRTRFQNANRSLSFSNVAAKDAYHSAVCQLLEIDMDAGKKFSLDQLRAYARAYNQDLSNQFWRIADFGEHYALGVQVFDASGGLVMAHFAHIFTQFAPIACARGDFNSDNTLNNAPGKNENFSCNGNDFFLKALGLVENECGLLNWSMGY